ncbi:MAG: hypothetical protein R3E73_12130 [Porticoccaceae bacterium]
MKIIRIQCSTYGNYYKNMDGPKHNKAKKYFSSGLFDQLKDFSELERRIELLDSNKDKGDAFEVFAEAYINLNPILMAKEVWPFESIPIKIKKNCGSI